MTTLANHAGCQKVMCSLSRPMCKRCATQGFQCLYPVQHPESESVSLAPILNDVFASKAELERLIQAFFVYVYPVEAMTFVRRGEIFHSISDGTAAPILVKAICGVSARYVAPSDNTDPDGGKAAASWIQEAKAGLMIDTDRFSTSKLAATLCIKTHEFNSGRPGSAWLFTPMAVRMALAMGLNDEEPDATATLIERETRRRLMWSAFCADAMAAGESASLGTSLTHAGGQVAYLSCPAASIRCALPCDDNLYALGTVPADTSATPWDLGNKSYSTARDGLTTRWIRIMAIRNEMLQCVATDDRRSRSLS